MYAVKKTIVLLGVMMVVFFLSLENKVNAADYYLCTYGNGSYYVMTDTVEEVEAAASCAYGMKVKFVPTSYPDEQHFMDVTILYKHGQWLICRWDAIDGWKNYKVGYNYDYSGYLRDYIVKTYHPTI